MQPDCNCNQTKPASTLNVELLDGTTHTFCARQVVRVHVSTEVYPTPHLDEFGACHMCAHDAPLPVETPPMPPTQTTLQNFDDFTPLEDTQTEREVVRRPNHPGRGSGGTPSHCSRCRSPHRRAHITRVAYNGAVTKRCFDCQNTGNETAANLKAVRWAIFSAQDRFAGGSLIKREDILGVLYWTEARLNKMKASSSVRLTSLRAIAKSYLITLEEVEQ